MSYYDPEITEHPDKDVQLGREIYLIALAGRRGFRDDQLGIDDNDIWIDIFRHMGATARQALLKEK